MDKFETTKILQEVIPNENLKKELKKIERDDNAKGSLTTRNLPWIDSVKKVNKKIADSRIFGKYENEILCCLALDGSVDAHNAFQLITEEYLVSNVKLLCTYIFNSQIECIIIECHIFTIHFNKFTVIIYFKFLCIINYAFEV